MHEKEIELLKLLTVQNTWITSVSLSYSLHISIRSVKNYISIINNEYDLIQSSRNGFIIRDKEKALELINSQSSKAPQTTEERNKYILKKLLLSDEKFDLDELSDELFISRVTLNNEMSKLKLKLSEFELILKTKNNNVFIEGPDTNKKKMISELIYEDSKKSFISLDLIQSYLPNFDLSLIKMIIGNNLSRFHYFMDDFSLLNLVVHIAITMERSTYIDNEPIPRKKKIEINAHVQSIINQITQDIEDKYNLKFTEDDIYEFSLLIMTRVINEKYTDSNIEQKDIVGQPIIDLVNKIQKKTKETYNISLSNKDFKIRFSLHLRSLLIRMENGIKLKNSQMLIIKNSYPFIYDVSVFIADLIHQETSYLLSEDEIAYISLHIGVLIEERKAIKMKVKTVFLNPQYFFNRFDVVERCSQQFEDKMLVLGVASTEEELIKFEEAELVISTVPFTKYPNNEFIMIGYALSQSNQIHIDQILNKIIQNRHRQKIEHQLKTLLREDLFFTGKNFTNEKEAIHEICLILEQHQIVNNDFKTKLFEREAISSSAYSNIAMPHPLQMCANQSVIAVSLHPNSIQWGINQVNAIFMLAIHQDDRLFFKEIFDFITDSISDQNKLQMILKSKTYSEFIATLVSFK